MTTMDESIQVGAEINHPEYGSGTITFVGDEYIGVHLAEGREVLLKKKNLIASKPEADTTSDELPALQFAWPDSTFVWEPENQPHYPGSHWEPFYEDSDPIFDRLPELISQTSVFAGFGDMYPAPRKLPTNWKEGFHLCWPAPRCGLVLTLLIEENGNSLVGVCPYFSEGIEVSIEINEVTVWQNGSAAQIEGNWGNASVTFFDVSFLSNRAWYEAGKSYQFILSGIAYTAKPAELNELRVEHHPDTLNWIQTIAEKGNEEVPFTQEPETIQLKGSAMFLPVDEWDRDDYWFRGTICRVTTFDDWLGQSGWRVRVTVMRFDDENTDLDIFITRRVWAGTNPPETGQDIQGRLWLQGRLWYAHEWKLSQNQT